LEAVSLTATALVPPVEKVFTSIPNCQYWLGFKLCELLLTALRGKPGLYYHELFILLSVKYMKLQRWSWTLTFKTIILRLTTCLENLEMSGNLKHVREMSGILLSIRELSGTCQRKILSWKSVPNLITSWILNIIITIKIVHGVHRMQ